MPHKKYVRLQSSTSAASEMFMKIVFQRIPMKHNVSNNYAPLLPPFLPIAIPKGILVKEPVIIGQALRTNLHSVLISFMDLTIGM